MSSVDHQSYSISRLIRIAFLSLSLILSASFVTGCWDIRYLDRIAVVFAIAVDDDPSGKDKLKVTVQVVLPQNVAGGSTGVSGGKGPVVTTFTETSDTLFQALRKMTSMTSRRLYFSHTQLLVIGESVARKGIWPLLDLIDRNPEIRTDISVLLARGARAEQLLETTTLMEQIPVMQMNNAIRTNEKVWSQVYMVSVKDLLGQALSKKKQQVLPAGILKGAVDVGNESSNIEKIKPDVVPKLTTMGVFHEGKFLGYLSPKESLGLGWIMNKVNNTVINIPCRTDKGSLVYEVQSTSTKTVAHKSRESEYPEIELTVTSKGRLSEITCPDINVNNESVLEQISKQASELIHAEMQTTIKRVQNQYRSDIFGWSDTIYKDIPNVWQRMEPQWDTIFPQISYHIHVNSTITSVGLRGTSIVK